MYAKSKYESHVIGEYGNLNFSLKYVWNINPSLNVHSLVEPNSLLTHLFRMHIFPLSHTVPSTAAPPDGEQNESYWFPHHRDEQINEDSVYLFIYNFKNSNEILLLK